MSLIIVLDSSDDDETPAKKKIAFPRINSATTITVVNKQNTVPSDSTNQNNSINRKTTFVKNNTLISKMLLEPDVTTTMAKPKASTLSNMNAGYTIKPTTKAPNTPSTTKKPTTPTPVEKFTAAMSNMQQIQPKLRQIQPKPQQQQQKTQQPLQQLQQKAAQLIQSQKSQQIQMQKPMQMRVHVQKPQQLQFQKPQEPQVKKPQQLQFQRPQEPPGPKPAQPQLQWPAHQLQMQKPMQLQVQKPQQQQIRKPQEPPAPKPGQPQIQKPQQLQLQKLQEPPAPKPGQSQLQKPQHPKVQKTQVQKSQQMYIQTPQQIQLQKQQQSQKLQKIQLQKQLLKQQQHQIQQQQTMQLEQQQQKQQLQPKQQTMQHEQQQQKQQLQPKQQEIMQQQKKKQLQQQKQQQKNFEQQMIQQQTLQTQQKITQQHRTAQQNHELIQQQVQQIHQQMQKQLPQNQQLQPHQLQQQQKPKPNPRKRKIPTPPVPVSLTAAPTPEQACNMLFPSLMMMMNSSGTMMPMIQSVHSMGDMPSAMPPLQLLSTPVPPPPPPIIPTTTIESSPFVYSCQPSTASRSLSPVMKNHNDNFKIHLPLKQPNYITCSPLAATATSTSTASALRSIKRIKPTTLLKNNDAAWLQRQQTKSLHLIHLISSSSTPFSIHDNEFLRAHLASPASSSVLRASSSTALQQGYGSSTPVSRWVPGQQRSPTTITPAISSITSPTSSRSVTPKTTPVKAPVTPTMRSQALKDYLDKPPTPLIRVVYKTTPKTITQTSTLSRLTPTLGTPQQATKSPRVFDLTKSPEKPKIYTLPAVTVASTSSSLNPRVVNTLNENETTTSSNPSNTIESSSETSTPAEDQPCPPFVPEFESLLNVCRKADPSDDMDALIRKKLTRYYYSVDPGFVHSDGFRKQLQSTIERIKGDPQLVYYNLKGIIEELKVRCLNMPKMVCPEPVVTSEIAVETTSTGNEHTDEQIRQLNKALSLIRKRIEELEQSEVDWDDDDSSYLQVERFQKRACQIFEKICELSGESNSTISQIRKPIKFTGTTYPQFNRTLSAYVNQTNEFPDYFDVLRVLEHCKSKYSLGLAQFEMKHIAEDAFIKVGKSLQARRKTDLYETVAHYTANAKDPATADPILLAKLSENQKHKKKISVVLEKYAREQDMNAEEIRLKKAATIAANSGANADGAKALPIVENGKYNKTDAVVAKIVKESKDYGIDNVDNDDDDDDDEEEDEEEDDDDDDVEIVGVVENMSITEITGDDDDNDDDDEDDGNGDGDNNDDDDVEFIAGDEDEKKSDELKEKSETKLDKLETKNITVVCNNITTFTTTNTTTITTTNTSKTTVTKTATSTPIIVNKDNLTAKSSLSHSSDRNGNLVKNSQTEQQQSKPNNHSNNNNIKPNFFSLVHGNRPTNNLLSLRLDKNKTTPALVTATVTVSVTASATSTSTATATTTSINYKPIQQQMQQKQIMINGKMTNVKRVTLVPPPPTSQCNAAPATTLRISSVASLNSSIYKTSRILNTKPLSSGAAAVPFKPRIFPDIVISDEES